MKTLFALKEIASEAWRFFCIWLSLLLTLQLSGFEPGLGISFYVWRACEYLRRKLLSYFQVWATPTPRLDFYLLAWVTNHVAASILGLEPFWGLRWGSDCWNQQPAWLSLGWVGQSLGKGEWEHDFSSLSYFFLPWETGHYTKSSALILNIL